MEYYSAIKKNVDGPKGKNAKWNKADRNINTVWFCSYVEFEKQNKWIRDKIDKYREQTGGCQEAGEVGRK